MNSSDSHGFWTRLAPWTLTAGLVVLATWLTGHLIALSRENESLRTERLLAEVAYKEGQSQLAERSLLAENMINRLGGKLRQAEDLTRLKISLLVSPAGNPPESRAVSVWDPDQQVGLVRVEQLPANGSSQDYQIWLIEAGRSDPVDAGIFHVETTGARTFAFKTDVAVAHLTALIVSLEKRGGAAKMEGPVVLRSQ